MRLRELCDHLDDHPDDDASSPGPQSIDNWLDVFDRLLHLPEPKRTAVRDELRGHLTERVRDLTLRGAPAEQAMQQAISELGEAAELAQQIRRANRYPRRRLIMNVALAALGTAVVATSVAVFSTGGPSNGVHTAVFEQSEQRADDADVLQSVRIDVDDDMTLRQIIKRIADTDELGVSVDWGSLQQIGIEPDEPFGFTADDASVLTLLNVINRRYDDTYDVIDWRLRDHRGLAIDRREVFDRQERMLVSYDIAEPLRSMDERYGIPQSVAVEQTSSLIYEMVDPEQWDVNGGAVAQLRVVGGKMFINAPPRMHEQVKWIIRELSDGGLEQDSMLERDRALGTAGTDQQRIRRAAHALRELGMAWVVWHEDHPDAPLENIGQLEKTSRTGRTAFNSPMGPAPDGRDYWIDYGFYARSDDVPWNERIVAIDRAAHARGMRTPVLYADCHVEMLTLEELKQQLAKPMHKGLDVHLPQRRAEAVLDDAQQNVRIVELKQQMARQSAELERMRERVEQVRNLAQRIDTLEHELEVTTLTKNLMMQDIEKLRAENEQLRRKLEAGQASRGPDLRPGDVVTVRIFELFSPGEWFEITRELDARGVYTLPEVGEVQVLGRTESDVEEAIRTKLSDLIAHPHVVVARQPLQQPAERMASGRNNGP